MPETGKVPRSRSTKPINCNLSYAADAYLREWAVNRQIGKVLEQLIFAEAARRDEIQTLRAMVARFVQREEARRKAGA